jgi:PPM family protein phosphatase
MLTATAPAFSQRVAAVTEQGRRPRNEDAVLAVELPDGTELLAVADGMGGYAAGELASRRALEVLRDSIAGGATLRQAVEAANAAVLAEAAEPGREGMGTTLVALLRRGDEYHIANVGDSRAYRVDGLGVMQLTRDHSFVEEAVASGQMTADEAGASPWRNAVTRALGIGPDVEVDCFGPFSADEGHVVVLCSDGFYRGVDDASIAAAVAGSQPSSRATAAAGSAPRVVGSSGAASMEGIAAALARAAYEAGSDDNISVALAAFGPGGRAATPPVERRRGDRGGRRRRHRATRRWALLEMAAILLGMLGVMLYVAFLARLF